MNKVHILRDVLPNLRKEAQFLEENKEFGGPTELWFSATIDALNQVLPQPSMLLEELQNSRKQYSAGAREPEANKQLAKKLVKLIDYAIDLGYEPVPHEPQYVKEQEDLIHGIISRTYLNAWWFKIPAGLLLVALAFVVTGEIQIKNFKVNIYDETEKAIARTKTAIKATEDTAIKNIEDFGKESKGKVDQAGRTGVKNLEDHVREEKARIKGSTDKHIDGLMKEKPPSFNQHLETLEDRIKKLEKKQDLLQTKVEIVNTALENALKRKDRLPLEELGSFLGWSRKWVLGELTVITLALVLLIVQMIYRFVKKP